MIVIYCPYATTRLSYVLKQMFALLPGAEYTIVHHQDAFLSTNAAPINYSNVYIEGALNIFSEGLLEKTGLEAVEPVMGQWEDVPVLFANTGGDIPFDIFSATFFLLSRYEEYDITKKDVHGRFMAKHSIAFKHNFLQLPLINIWMNCLRKLLNNKFSLSIPPLPVEFIPTIDVDHVFYYRNKAFWLQVAGSLKQLLKGKWGDFLQRWQTVMGLKNDPNDSFEWLAKQHQKQKMQPIYFFYMGNKGANDPSPQFHHKDVLTKIFEVSAKNCVGIHPSYNSLNNEALVLEEKERLEKIIQKKIQHSRQHYLRFRLPQTYRVLEACNIVHEYSMGYADVAGYRAGIAAPFFWYDIENEKETNLCIHPFAVMDVTLKNYMNLSVEKAKETIEQLFLSIQQNGGVFITLWHNESVGDLNEWHGWKKVYEETLALNNANGNYLPPS